ncbi:MULTISPECIES: GNAT family N-acetyltransferase [unclassified Pseudoalteromonas]|uniref:GNAT family N-acetyltransferase n=1 Tax=unclassified Pseudoalteromonas TaxID=194690 RepID=UPI0005A982DD|nr:MULTISPECIES: GNAT family N-acetyltransferase [unclassified Pseudoalteromonas]
MKFENYQSSDFKEIADLFHGSVHSISSDFYTSDELEAWSPSPPNYDEWKMRLENKQPYKAIVNDQIVGFIELERDGHIDCLYIHKEFKGQGIGSRLLEYAIEKAMNNGIYHLYAEASKVARPIFEKQGFSYNNTNHVKLRGQSLINYSMSLKLQP